MVYVSFKVILGALIENREGLRRRGPIVNEVRTPEPDLSEAAGI
jgi:hypothetical protein